MSTQNQISKLIGQNWLKRHANNLINLEDDVFIEICKFTVLWQLFEKMIIKENEVHENDGAATKIKRGVDSWYKTGCIARDAFKCSLNYFRKRYVEDGEFNYRFKYLEFKSKSNRSIVVKALMCKNGIKFKEDVLGVLILIYQYRNQLFHANKLVFGLEDQQENFQRANAVLMEAIEMQYKHRRKIRRYQQGSS